MVLPYYIVTPYHMTDKAFSIPIFYVDASVTKTYRVVFELYTVLTICTQLGMPLVRGCISTRHVPVSVFGTPGTIR